MKIYWNIPEEFAGEYANGSKEFTYRVWDSDIDLTADYPFIYWIRKKLSWNKAKKNNDSPVVFIAEEGEKCKVTSWFSNEIVSLKSGENINEIRGSRDEIFNKTIGNMDLFFQFNSFLMSISAIRTISTLLIPVLIFMGLYGYALILSVTCSFIGDLEYASVHLYHDKYIIKKGAKLFKITSNQEITIYPRAEFIKKID